MKNLAAMLLIGGLSAQFSTGVMAGVVEGDIEAGKSKAAVCGACHGADGNSKNPQWPSLAGQHANYLLAQLQAYKDGSRKNPIMASQASLLSEADMKNLSVFFAAQKAKVGVGSPDSVEVAGALYRGGNSETGVAACNACHGPQGEGNLAAGYPAIGGQQKGYLADQLKAFRSGSRKGTATGDMMSAVAKNLTDDEIAALAAYLPGLH